VAILFNIVVWILPVPESWRAVLAPLAVAVFLLAVIGWLTAHSETLRRLRFGKRGTHPVTLIIVGIVGAIVFVGGWLLYAKLFVQETKPEDVTTKRFDEIQQQLKALGESASRESLLKEYELGYVVFEIDYKNSVFPYDQQLLDQYDIDWSVVKLQLTANRYQLRLPNMRKKVGGSPVISGVISGPKEVSHLSDGYFIEDLMVMARILALHENGAIFVVGLTHTPPELLKATPKR
jgi:hypothetical protein